MDAVSHPQHYTSSGASCPDCGRGIECIDVTQGMSFCLGNADRRHLSAEQFVEIAATMRADGRSLPQIGEALAHAQGQYDKPVHPQQVKRILDKAPAFTDVKAPDRVVGNVVKYAWRAGLKGDAVEDLRKAQQYLQFEIARLERAR